MIEKIKTGRFASITIIVVAVCIFVALAVMNINGSIWFDESYTAYLIRGDFGQIWEMTALDVHPPLYYWALKSWSLLFGTSIVALRSMSVFLGAAAIILSFIVLKKLFSKRTAAFGVIAMSFAPLFIRYAEEMRMYMLVLVIVMMASWVLLNAIEKNKRWLWVTYGILVSLGVWTHYFSALIWIAQLVYLVIVYRKKIFQVNILLSYGVAFLLFLPWMPNFLHQFSDVGNGFWISAVTMLTPWNYLTESLVFVDGGQVDGWMTIILVTLIIGTFWLFARVDKRQDSRMWFLVCMVVLPGILLFLVSLPPRTSLFMTRYVVYSSILLWALFGVILAESKNVSLVKKLLFGALVILTGVYGCMNVINRDDSGDMKQIVKYVEMNNEQGLPVVAIDEWAYYDAVFYDSDNMGVYGIGKYFEYEWGSYQPIKNYKYHVLDDYSDLETDSFWLVADRSENIDDSMVGHDCELVMDEDTSYLLYLANKK